MAPAGWTMMDEKQAKAFLSMDCAIRATKGAVSIAGQPRRQSSQHTEEKDIQ